MLLNYLLKPQALNETDQKHGNIFILHGLFGSLSNLSPLAKSLASRQQTICVDLRNHGNSQHSKIMTYDAMANDIFTLADHLDIEHFSIIGHSMGGKVAMSCALQQPQRVNKLVIADIAPVSYDNKHSSVFAGLNAIRNCKIENKQEADIILSQYVKEAGVRQFLLKSLRLKNNQYDFQFNLDALSRNYDHICSWPEYSSAFVNQTLFIKGANSDYINTQSQPVIQRLFPNASGKIIENTGHWLHAEKPDIFNRLVGKFFSV
ncbi:alpha/beta fold hydrolase [Psychromonas sp. MME2]|uniref:alpha/beta fold hydrolase n=1 Tax=unclassified Psychromonas TaxID=2614957 RepID=UPI00339C4E64